MHCAQEFTAKDAAATMATMVAEPYVNHVPVLTGGVGKAQLLHFYATKFIPCNPPDLKLTRVSLTVGESSLAEELVLSFTHSCATPGSSHGMAPTGRAVAVALVALVRFEGDKLASEHIYWDQATVLVQIGLLRPAGLPVAGAASARKMLDKTAEPSNALMRDE